jgi:protein phosphatase 1 regulatory subunit 7
MYTSRINNPQAIDRPEIENLAAKGRVVVQFSTATYSHDLLKELNLLARTMDRALEIRFFGFYTEEFDASVLQFIPDAPCISIDSIKSARNLDALSNLVNLKEFHLEVYEMNWPDILSLKSLHDVENLGLGSIRKTNIDLSHLQNFKNLRSFHTSGQIKNINVLSSIQNLSTVSLSMIKSSVSLAFLSDIKKLHNLRIMLGGRQSISEIEGKELRSLEIQRVRGLGDLGPLSRFPKLNNLDVKDQLQLRQIKFGRNPQLQNIKILNCKNLEHIEGLHVLKSLKMLHIYKTALNYKNIISSDMPVSLTKMIFCTGRITEDKDIQQDLAGKGLA